MEATNTKRTYTKRLEKKQPLQTKHSGAITVTGRTHPLETQIARAIGSSAGMTCSNHGNPGRNLTE